MERCYEDGKPGYLTKDGKCLTFRYSSLEEELKAFEAAKASYLKEHYGTTEGALKGWDVRGRGRKEEEKTEDKSKMYVTKINIKQSPAKDFVEARDKLPKDLRAFLTPYTPEQYEKDNVKLFLEESGRGGFGLKGDEIISVFSLPGAHVGRSLVDHAIEKGGRRLDCIGKKLCKLYREKGFRVTQTIKWDDKYKPDGWNTKKYGKPNIYLMELKEPRK